VWRLERALYGLKQAQRGSYTRINKYLIDLGFTKSEADANLYHIMVEDKWLIIVLYVDDLILTGDEQLIKSFGIKDMGLMHYFLDLEVWKGDGELFVSGNVCLGYTCSRGIEFPQEWMMGFAYFLSTYFTYCFSSFQFIVALYVSRQK